MNSPIRLRPAREEERAALGAMKLRASLAWGDHVELLRALPEAAELAPSLLPFTFIAESQGIVIGFATLVIGDEGRAEIEELFVEPDRWREGAGRLLVEQAVHRARAAGADRVHVIASTHARAFYESLGFSVVGEVATRFEPAPHMVRPIAPAEAVAGEIANRMAEIVGQPPRIEPLAPEEVTDELYALITRLTGSLGMTPLSVPPEYFRTMMKHPALFRCQLETGTALFQGLIGGRERELAVLRIAWLAGAPYEWGEHVALASLFGLTPEEIERVTLGSAAPGWSDLDSAILRGVEELLDDRMISDATWAVLARSWSEAQLIEFPTLVGVYLTTAFQQNALRMRLAEDNPGLSMR